MKQHLYGILLVLALVGFSCNSSKNITASKKTIELASRGPNDIQNIVNQEVTTPTNNPETLPINTITASQQEVLVEKKAIIQTKLARIEQVLSANKSIQKLTFVERFVLKKVLKKVEKQQKLSATNLDFDDWDSNLKIGVILIAVAVVLSVLRVSGAVTGLAALVGLIFVVLGLLNTY